MEINNLLLLMLLKSFLLGASLYLILRLRPWLGLMPLVITIGTFQFVQVILAMSVYIEIFPGLLVSPGSSILFTGTIISVLLVYIVDDADGARKFIYSLLIANIAISLISYSIYLYFLSSKTHFFVAIPSEVFLQNPRVMIVGTVALLIDTILIILVYEFLSRIPVFFLRLWLSISIILIIDSFLFITGTFIENENYLNLLSSNILGKLIMTPAPVLAISILDKIFKSSNSRESKNISDLFSLLTYKHKFELVKKEAMNDGLTGLKSRRTLDRDNIDWEKMDLYTILLIDVDKFKSINDIYGHQIGDIVLKEISTIIHSALRLNDAAYRYGGEEFIIFLPGVSLEDGTIIAKRIRNSVKQISIKELKSSNRSISVTIGVSSRPNDGMLSKELINVADQRMYYGKKHGRDQVINKTFQ